MTTDSMLKKNNVIKDRLLEVFAHVGHPMSEPTLNARLKDQRWSYAHASLLRNLGLWAEPQLNALNSQMVMYILGQTEDYE